MKLAALVFLPLMVTGAPEETPADDLARVQSEPHPDKRAHMALDNADDALKQAREAYDKGDNETVAARLQEVERSVELAESSLKQTGKNPSRAPKHFKYAELKTRDLLRKLESFREAMSVADRPALDRVIGTVQKIHDALLDGIMGKNK
jgi:monoamine oxidase